MTSKSMTFRFPAALAQAIEAQARATGRDRTTVVAEALAEVFGLSLPSKASITIELLQQQLEQVEQKVTLLSEQIANLQQLDPSDGSIAHRMAHTDAVLFSTKEITDRQHLEMVLQAAQINYQSLFESTNDSILIVDASTRRILNANTNASRRLGYTRQELLTLGSDQILQQSAEDREARFQQLRAAGRVAFASILRHQDGTPIPVEICSWLVEYGDRLAIQSFIHDSHTILDGRYSSTLNVLTDTCNI